MNEPNNTVDEIRKYVSYAICDGQNQIHDLKNGVSTGEQINERMLASVNYHSNKVEQAIEQYCQEREAEAYKRGYANSSVAYTNAIHRYEVTRDYPQGNLYTPISEYVTEAELSLKSKGEQL